MKFSKIIFIAISLLMATSANAQYQIQNSDFEEWESITYNKRTGEEPVLWSSFLDGTGSLKSTAGYSQISKETDVRPGSNGNYSAKLTSRAVKLFGVTLAVAQGNLTTGCVNMGSTTATDAKGNYNYINESREDQSMKFSGRPDSVKVWTKFKGAKTGNIEVVLTTKGYYQAPEANQITAKLIARAQNDTIPSTDEWKEYSIPFNYVDSIADSTYYVLINISTCAVPGAGKESDYMYVDDMTCIYNSELDSIVYAGNMFTFEGQECLVDEEYDESKIAIYSNGKGASIVTEYDAENAVLTINVNGNNISEDESNFHTYTVQFRKPRAKYTVTYIVDDYTESYDVLEGDNTPEYRCKNLAKLGYKFAGWTPSKSEKVTGDATYTAEWTADTFKIIYFVDSVEYKSTDAVYGTATNVEEAPSKEGYTFSGWSEIPDTVPANNIYVYGTFSVNTYTIVYKYNNDTINTVNINYGDSIPSFEYKPEDTERYTYSFGGWMRGNETFEMPNMPAEDIVLEAVISYTDGIEKIEDDNKIKEIYNQNGVRTSDIHKGINIVKMNNGSFRKIYVK